MRHHHIGWLATVALAVVATKADAATYAYDGASRLASVTSGATTVTYAYDGEGALVRRCVNGACSDVRTSAQSVVGDSSSVYAYGPNGAASQKTPSGASAHFMGDNLGTVRGAASDGGATLSRAAQDAYGLPRATTGTAPALGYTGEYTGAEDRTVWLRARTYAPDTGRFLQRDAFAGLGDRPQSLHRYGYVEGRPLSLTDPSGRTPLNDPHMFPEFQGNPNINLSNGGCVQCMTQNSTTLGGVENYMDLPKTSWSTPYGEFELPGQIGTKTKPGTFGEIEALTPKGSHLFNYVHDRDGMVYFADGTANKNGAGGTIDMIRREHRSPNFLPEGQSYKWRSRGTLGRMPPRGLNGADAGFFDPKLFARGAGKLAGGALAALGVAMYVRQLGDPCRPGGEKVWDTVIFAAGLLPSGAATATGIGLMREVTPEGWSAVKAAGGLTMGLTGF